MKKLLLIIVFACVWLAACASPSRMGMVTDEATGLQYGSMISNNIVVDSTQFDNRKIKVRIRNTSGDAAFDLYHYKMALETAYAAKGYIPTDGDDFGILLDVNVVYSGQATKNLSSEYAWIGALAGGGAGFAATSSGGGGTTSEIAGASAGAVVGATLGAIVGSYQRDETYIVISDVSLAVVDPARSKSKTTITFNGSNFGKKKRTKGFTKFSLNTGTNIACYAGGRNITQSAVVQTVRQRFVRILSDVI